MVSSLYQARDSVVIWEWGRQMSSKSRSQYDFMTKTPVSSLIIRLSVPTVISMLVTNVYNMADTAFVGQLGNSASGAVGVVFGYMAIIQAVGFMFGQGAGSIISRMLGSKDDENASIIASTGFFMTLAVSTLIAAAGFIFINPLVMLLGSTETIAPYAINYLIYILAATPFITTSFIMNNILRFEGRAALGMIGLFTGAVVNIGLDPLFIFVFNMGIAGAGLATAISQLLSFCILLSMFLRRKTQSRISIKKVTLKIRTILNIVTTGLPSLLRQGLNSVTTVLLNYEAALYGGDAAVAAMSIVSRISMLVLSIIIGVGQGFQPVSAFNYGAGKYSRVRKGFAFTTFLSEIILIVLIIPVIIFSGSLISLFRNDATVIEIGSWALILQCIALLFLPPCAIIEMQLQSTGQRLSASVLSSLRNGLFFLPTLLILANLRGISGVQEAQPLSYLLSFLPSILFAVSFFKKLPKEDK